MPSTELAQALDFMAKNAVPLDATVPERRAILEARARALPAFAGVQANPVAESRVAGEWVTLTDGNADRVIFFIHGGGFVAGTAAGSRDLVARLCLAAGARSLSIDYRLAPEYPFPAGLEDCVSAYRWLLAQGVPPARCALAGPSAGGGLVVALLVALRDAGDPLPGCAICLSPMVDMTASGSSYDDRSGRDVMNAGVLRSFTRHYLGVGDPHQPLASPVFADLRGLPPLLIQVGSVELLLDDAKALAARGRACGVAVTYEEWPDMFHGWQSFAATLPEARAAVASLGDFIRTHCR